MIGLNFPPLSGYAMLGAMASCYQPRIISVLIAVVVLLLASSGQAAEPVPIIDELPGIETSPLQVIDHPGSEHALNWLLQDLLEGRIGKPAILPFNLGLQDKRYLLGFTITNLGARRLDLQILTGASYRPYLTMHISRRDGRVLEVLRHSHQQAADQRNNRFRHLNSMRFSIEAGETLQAVVDYYSVGSSYLPLSLGSPQQVSAALNQDLNSSALFYGFSLSALRQERERGVDSDGSGLGLAICAQLATEHGLDFDISSRPGHGTVAQITLPR
jgi:hypothetical protein